MGKALTNSLETTQVPRQTSWSENFARNQQMNGHLQVESLQKFLDGSTSWFKCEWLLEDWLNLTVLEVSKRRPALKDRFVKVAEKYKGLSIENLGELMMESSIFRIR